MTPRQTVQAFTLLELLFATVLLAGAASVMMVSLSSIAADNAARRGVADLVAADRTARLQARRRGHAVLRAEGNSVRLETPGSANPREIAKLHRSLTIVLDPDTTDAGEVWFSRYGPTCDYVVELTGNITRRLAFHGQSGRVVVSVDGP
ncbi:MAG: hypothetical protein AAGB51_15125 [Planctomycetota bacterium]